MFIMHEKSMDVAFKIDRRQYQDYKRKKLRGTWWNLGYTGNPWPAIHLQQTITILTEDWPKWKVLHPGQEYVARTKPGRP